MTKVSFLTLKSPGTHAHNTLPLRGFPFDQPEILPSEMSPGDPHGRTNKKYFKTIIN